MSEVRKQCLVCSDPQIWVFDDLLSEALLNRVDAAFTGKPWKKLNGRDVRIVELTINEQLEELTHTLRDVSQIEEIQPCRKAWIMDVQGKDQTPHMDGWDMAKHRQSTDELDMSRFSVQRHQGFPTIIPTLSFVVYFNDVGGCTFPHAAMSERTIPARRGRILMFHNYVDSQRPKHNPSAMHFGTYGDTPKRVMTAGMLSEETPAQLLGAPGGGPKTPGLLYAPIMHNARASCPSHDFSPPRTPPRSPSPEHKQVIQLFARLVAVTTQPQPAGGQFQADGDVLQVEAKTLSGETIGDIAIAVDETLGALRNSLGLNRHAKLVFGATVLEGGEEKRLRDTALSQCAPAEDLQAQSVDPDSVIQVEETLAELDISQHP